MKHLFTLLAAVVFVASIADARPNRRLLPVPKIASTADVAAGTPNVLVDAELLKEAIDNIEGLVSGNDGWTPVFAVATDGDRRVLRVIDWTGGEGTKPATGQYVGASGLVESIVSAVDIRGATGATGAAGTSVTSGGVWSAGTDYPALSIVSHLGTFWFAQTDPTTGEEPGVASDWVDTLVSATTVTATDGQMLRYNGTSEDIEGATAGTDYMAPGATNVLTEGGSILLDPVLSADGTYTITRGITGTGGATIAFGDLVQLSSADGRWELVSVSAAVDAVGDARGLIGIAVTASSDGGAITVMLEGNIRADAAFPPLTVGRAVFASTSGDISLSTPTTSGHVIRVIGHALTADSIIFAPAAGWSTYTP